MPDWKKRFSFWGWLAKGAGGKAGWRNLWDWWLLLHVSVGIALTYAVKDDIAKVAGNVLLPLTAVLIGLSIAWAGNALALLQSQEIVMLTSHHPDGSVGYVYTYQLAILSLLITIGGWGLAALGVFDCVLAAHPVGRRALVFLLFGWTSLCVRECWGVMQFTHLILLARQTIRNALDNKADPENEDTND